MICLLRIIEGPLAGQKFWLRDDQVVTIGRLSTSDFPIPTDMHLSRRHMMVEGLGDNFRLRDVGSSNGTFVNNVKISVAGLCNHDLVRAGESVFEVTFHVERPNDNFDFNDARAMPTVYSDSSPTSCFSGSLVDDLPIRSLNTNLPKSGGENLKKTGENRSESATPADSKIVNSNDLEKSREHSALLLGMLQTNGFLFSESKTAGLYQLERTMDSGTQTVLDVFEVVTKLYNCSLVINESQVDERNSPFIDSLSSNGGASRISQTLVVVPLDLSLQSVQLVKCYMKMDGLILVGLKDPIPDSWLDSIADVLSYPSMLEGLLGAEKSRLGKRLGDFVDCVMFESRSPQGIKLLLPHLANPKS